MVEDLPFGGPARYYNYQCSKCGFKEGIDEIIVDVNYEWTKKRTKTSDGESVPVLECPICDNGTRTFTCID
jgi:C4-type Zn-finger protein